ncbi:MAG: bifunctional DNA primase/polymerase [Candidatus Micrarchaeaceae archaeon]
MSSRINYLMDIAKIAINYGFVPIPIFDKYPRFKNWQNVTLDPNDPEKLVRRFKHLYDHGLCNNIAILTGEKSGVVVLDVDKTAIGWFNERLKENGAIDTFTVKTGKDGYHFYFKYTDMVKDLPNLNKINNLDIDFRTNGGIVVFPGSINEETGKKYVVFSGYDDKPKIEEMPEWIYNMLVNDFNKKRYIKRA